MAVCETCGTESPEGAKFCLECGAPMAAPSPAGEERKLVTVLFADVAGSTALGERLDAEALKDVMTRFFATMRGEIEAEGGTVEKFIGDAVMAAFGVPVAHEDDPARALRAALRMQRRLAELNGELADDHRVELAVRIGVNTGLVMATTSPRPGEAMATGDPVNLAARLQQLAEPGTVLVGERTAAAVRGFVLSRAEGSLDVRGKADPVAAFRLEGERDEPERGVPGLRAPIVGRDSELELLRSVLHRVSEEGRGHLVTIYGDPGVGKSRLVAEFTSTADARVLRGRCLPYGDGITFWPFAEIAKAEVGLLDTDSTATALAKVAALGESAPELAGSAPAIAHTIGLDDPDSPLRGLTPRAVITEIQRAWRAFFAWTARSGPVVVVVEDIHWADGAMLGLLEELPDRIPAPVLFLCPSRPELTTRRPGWGGGRRSASSLSLDPLGTAEADRLVRLLLDIDDLGDGLRGRILERAEGNPFFLEEIVRRLIDEELITHESGRWRALAGIDDVAIPDTVQGVLAARIDLLPADEKRVVQSAAVVGRVFWPGAVAGLLNGEAERVEQLLDGLERRDLVLSRLTSSMSGERELIFKHILTRDVAYESLPRRDRPHAHACVAEWIEGAYGERRLEVAELLAHHHELAGQREQARSYALDAARRDLGSLALEQALDFAGRAAELAQAPADRAAALAVAGEAHYQRGDGDDAWRFWREALELLEPDVAADPGLVATLCGRLGLLATRAPGLMPNVIAEPDEVRRYLELGFAAAGDEESDALVELLLAEGGWSFGFPTPPPDQAMIDRMGAASARAVAIAERLDRAELLSLALDVAYISAVLEDDVLTQAASVERRQALADRVYSIVDLDDIFYMSAQTYYEQGRYREALAVSEEGIARVSALGGEPRGSASTAALSRMLMGEWDPVLEQYAAIREHFGNAPAGFLRLVWAAAEFVFAARGETAKAEELRVVQLGTPMRLGFRALGLLAEGRLDEAFAQVPSALFGDGVSFGMIVEGELMRAAGRWDELVAHCAVIRARADRIAWQSGWPAADRLESAVAFVRSDPATAAVLAERSVAGFTEIGAEWEAAVSGLDLAGSLITLGRGGETAAVLAAAEPALRRAGALAELRRLDDLRARQL